ncbi:Putative lipopolysaccharide core biosynthesis glycosyltransferase, WaaE-like [Desulfonema limicola]|uniref:Lipopolysaccharide core biosynthesis glycosyltransferase, WaaE-like n=1 Tax=Desulfonema limicola TaxID=45656 RepID=A0A975B7B3_9BACT|nr:glycosyltransferase family 2 protein [Desulfonema limicola]QTA80185.1 Putative lipopolysaccharide core biosynthesis glycosyltransferase, WaaE-like [Desulfonema limicola]
MPLSIAIITYNEADRISHCLESVLFADEIVVVDSFSTDNTIEIAQNFGCKVLTQKWPGFSRQKQFAVDNCKNDWVLILDADEQIPEQTAEEIKKITAEPEKEIYAYNFLRKNFLHGRWIKHCGWWPNRVTRLVNKKHGNFDDRPVHEKWICSGPVKKLDLFIEHYSFRNYEDMINKMQTYSSLAAKEMKQQDKKIRWWSPISHGMWMFFKTYILETGFMEGFDGLVISLLNAQGSFMKYAKAYEKMS